MKPVSFALLAAVILLGTSFAALAKVTGKCVNCHTIHNSQNSATVAVDFGDDSESPPYSSLVNNSCIGCHSSTDSSTWQDTITGAPIVYNTNQPSYGYNNEGLAAGNFYWVKSDDKKGHNIFPDNPDDRLSQAPGASSASCGASNSCHANFSTPYSGVDSMQGKYGCQGCHMVEHFNGFHHAPDTTDTIMDTETEGWYRFLEGHQSGSGSGVSGIEDPDWQKTVGSADHNEYLGNSKASVDKTKAGKMGDDALLGNTMTGFCCGCHGNFHLQGTTSVGASPWIRHPSDSELLNSGEYASYTTYDPLAPVARPSLSGVGSTVNPGTDLVMCLSCHRAHASPYDSMMRWDYASDTLSTALSGCAVCHTEKN